MTWGVDLWDQHDNLASHTARGLDFLDRFGRFLRDRCDVESRYAADLRGLVKKYQPRKKDEELQLTSHTAVRSMLSEVNDLAGQHELIAEHISGSLYKDAASALRELKDDRKRMFAEAERLQTQLHTQRLQLDKSKRNYEKAFKESERAQDNYRKSDKDLNLSRAEVEKQRLNADIKNRQCEDCKNEYANQLQKTNDLQHQHFSQLMPAIYDELQRLDERRGRCLQLLVRQLADVQRRIMPIVTTCLDGITQAADSIDVEQDGDLIIERYKTGLDPPEPIPFEDLSDIRDADYGSGGAVDSPRVSLTSSTLAAAASSAGKATLSAAKFKKKVSLFGMFGGGSGGGGKGSPVIGASSFETFVRDEIDGLPPNQRRKRIQARIDDITSKFNQENSTRDALMKMKHAYEGNPALGDSAVIDDQLKANVDRLEKLRCDLKKLQDLLEEGVRRASLCEPDGMLSRSASDSSMSQSGVASTTVNSCSSSVAATVISSASCSTTAGVANNSKHSAPSTPHASHTTSNSPESGLGMSHTSLPGCEFDAAAAVDRSQRHDSTAVSRVVVMPSRASGSAAGDHSQLPYMEEDDDEDELLPVIGESHALYSFDGCNDGAIPVCANETLLVIEPDQGDGWTRVRRQHSLEEGFVPTTYLHITLYQTQ